MFDHGAAQAVAGGAQHGRQPAHHGVAQAYGSTVQDPLQGFGQALGVGGVIFQAGPGDVDFAQAAAGGYSVFGHGRVP